MPNSLPSALIRRRSKTNWLVTLSLWMEALMFTTLLTPMQTDPGTRRTSLQWSCCPQTYLISSVQLTPTSTRRIRSAHVSHTRITPALFTWWRITSSTAIRFRSRAVGSQPWGFLVKNSSPKRRQYGNWSRMGLKESRDTLQTQNTSRIVTTIIINLIPFSWVTTSRITLRSKQLTSWTTTSSSSWIKLLFHVSAFRS